MYIRISKGKEEPIFDLKYDLTQYTLNLAKKEKKEFYFLPIDKKMKLPSLKFIAESAEQRLIWYQKLLQVMKTDDTDPLSQLALSPSFFDFQRDRAQTVIDESARSKSPPLMSG